MNNTNEKLNSDKHIMIAGIMSVFFAICSGAQDPSSLILQAGIPLYFSIAFMLTKHSFFGYACAVFYLLIRMGALMYQRTVLGVIMILAVAAYLAYAAHASSKDWDLRNHQKGMISRSKNLYGWLAFSQWILLFPYCIMVYDIYYMSGTASAVVIGGTVLKWVIKILNYVLAVVFIRKMCKIPHLSTAKKVAWGISMVLFTFLVFPLFWMVHLCREPWPDDEEMDCETSYFFKT